MKLTNEEIKAIQNVLEYADSLRNEVNNYFSFHKEYDSNTEHIYCSLRKLAILVYGEKFIQDFEEKL